MHCSRWLHTVRGTNSSLSLVLRAFKSSSFSRIRALTCSISSASSAVGSSWYALVSWIRGSAKIVIYCYMFTKLFEKKSTFCLSSSIISFSIHNRTWNLLSVRDSIIAQTWNTRTNFSFDHLFDNSVQLPVTINVSMNKDFATLTKMLFRLEEREREREREREIVCVPGSVDSLDNISSSSSRAFLSLKSICKFWYFSNHIWNLTNGNINDN